MPSRSTPRSSQGRECVHPDQEGRAIEPARAQAVLTALRSQSDQAAAKGGMRPVLLCSARVRRHLGRLVEQTLPRLAVCSYNEIASGISVETIGVVST
jgi:flagellar biosynthesis protein FlhA